MKHLSINRLLFLIPLLMLVLLGSGCKRKSVEQLLELGRIDVAQKQCENIKAEERADCYKTLALFFLKKGQFKKAAEYYAKAGEHIKVINSYFQGDLIPEAEKYCAEQTGETKKQCAARLGKKFFIDGDYNKAIQYYKISGDNENILYVQTKIPVFRLVELLNKKSGEINDFNLSGKLLAIKKTLNTYIYMDRYYEWPYDKKSEPYTRAAGIFENALKILDEKALPTIVNTVTDNNFDWSKNSIESLSFTHFQMENVINLIKHLHHIAEKREFFTKYSVVFLEKSNKEKKEPPQSLNYEEVYLKALDHSRMLLEEIEESGHSENKEDLEDYKHNMTIDIQVIDYLTSMINNVKIRISDIEKRSLKVKSRQESETVGEHSKKLFWDFIAQCNRVLHLISKEKYQEANDLLISSYQKAKYELEQFANKREQ